MAINVNYFDTFLAISYCRIEILGKNEQFKKCPTIRHLSKPVWSKFEKKFFFGCDTMCKFFGSTVIRTFPNVSENCICVSYNEKELQLFSYYTDVWTERRHDFHENAVVKYIVGSTSVLLIIFCDFYECRTIYFLLNLSIDFL